MKKTIAVSITGILSGYLLASYFIGETPISYTSGEITQNQQTETQNNTRPKKKQTIENIPSIKHISTLRENQLNKNEFIENNQAKLQRIATTASHALDSDDITTRLDGMFQLVDLNPAMAVEGIHKLLDRVAGDKTLEGAIVVGILSLGNNRQALPDQELANIYYSNDNQNVRGRVARVLSHRGDNSLLNEHLANIENYLETADEQKIIDTLNHLGSIESRQSVPLITPYFKSENKDVRFAALAALQHSGNIEDIELVTQLSLDSEAEVSAMAQRVIDYLLATKGKQPSPPELSNPT